MTRFKFYCQKLGINLLDITKYVLIGNDQFKARIEEEDLNLLRLTTSRFKISLVDEINMVYWVY